jgi:hypothetical protein
MVVDSLSVGRIPFDFKQADILLLRQFMVQVGALFVHVHMWLSAL